MLEFCPDRADARLTHLYCAKERYTMERLNALVGGLSKPSKMPGRAYSLPASKCNVGAKLRKTPGSVCSKCYAHKGRYAFGNVQRAMERRLILLNRDPSEWAANMVMLIDKRTKADRVHYFRWHDSGDLQGKYHLDAIVWIANELPHIKFWLPTKEYALVRDYFANVSGPENLTVRVSAPMIGQAILPSFPVTSTVGAGVGYACPSADQGNKCGPCRACWDPGVPNVDYRQH